MEKENNKLIAEFLIGTWNLDNLNMQCNTEYDLFSVTELGDVFADIEGDDPNAKHFFTPDEMEFHTSWSWLKPVVDKIEIKHQGVPQQLLHLSLFSTLDEVYNAVVEYITFYNETKL